ncbi:MAG: Holliday junction resolvase RuvX [Myxococcota bacterium]
MLLVGRALGVDYGTKRIGYALSDEMGWAAEPLEVWTKKSLEEDLVHLVALVTGHEVRRVVIGVPNRLDGTEGPEAKRALEWAEAVRAVSPVPIETRDEALTTWAAEERMRERGLSPKDRKKWVDAYAAAVILQEDLDARRP